MDHEIVVINIPPGDTAWVRIFHRSSESYEVVNGLAVDESGANLYITGVREQPVESQIMSSYSEVFTCCRCSRMVAILQGAKLLR